VPTPPTGELLFLFKRPGKEIQLPQTESEKYANQLIINDLAVGEGFEPKGPIENTQLIDSKSSQRIERKKR
jgi:hypothetical protein